MNKIKNLILLGAVAATLGNANSIVAVGKQSPNILFIEVDDLNYEYLSGFGSSIIHTPNIDRLTQTGVRFENAVCQGMMCAPSRNSLMTGLYPHNLGLYNNGEMKSLPEGIWTFPQSLQKSGYYTAWIGKCHIRPFGKDKTEAMKKQMGFDYVQQTEGRVVLSRKSGEENIGADDENATVTQKGRKNGVLGQQLNKNGKPKGEAKEKKTTNDWYLSFLRESGYFDQFVNEYPEISTLPEDVYLDGFFTHNAEDFLKSYNNEKPFFLWLNYSVPHGPYDVAQEYHAPFKPENMPGSTKPDFQVPESLVKKTKFSTNEKLHQEEQAGHCASVTFLDKQVGRIVDALKKNNQLDNTIIVFFSDQGVMLGDHQRNHKGTLYRQITNPALIISYPNAFQRGRVITSPVELTDLVNTTLDIANASEKEMNRCQNSFSLLPLLTGKKDAVRDFAFGEIDGYVMATDGRYRLIKGKDACLLFDDLKDPKNLHNIAFENSEIVQKLSKTIDEWLIKTGPVLPKNSL